MNINCLSVVDSFLNNLKSEFTVVSNDSECYIVTPFSRPDGEAIEVTLREKGENHFVLSDNFSTLDYLFVNGLNLESNKKLYEDAERIAKNRGVRLERSELLIEAFAGNEAKSLNELLNAIEAITYLVYRRTHRELKSFTDEVELFLAEHEITFNTSFAIQGKTIKHIVPIYVNSNKNLVISPLSATSLPSAKHKVKELAFTARDIKDLQPTVRFDALIDDRKATWEQIWSDADVSRILHAYTDETVRWENRLRLLGNLARKDENRLTE